MVTPIHDRRACVFGVIQGVEYGGLYTLDDQRESLVQAGRTANWAGDVNGFAPPGDIHRVRNVGGSVAISIHIYGTDVSRIGSSVRRYYDLPVKPSGPPELRRVLELPRWATLTSHIGPGEEHDEN